MPTPHVSQIPSYIQSGCSNTGTVTLSAMTAAYVAADDTDKGAWWNNLADDPWGSLFVADVFTNMKVNADNYAIQPVIDAVELLHWFYSPDTPPPAPPPITIADIQIAIDAGDPADQGELKSTIVDVPTVVAVVAQLNPAEATEIIGDIVTKAMPTVVQTVEDVCTKEFQFIKQVTDGVNPIKLEFGTDLTVCPSPPEPPPVNFTTDTIDTEVCGTDGLRTIQSYLLATPVNEAGLSGMGSVLGLVLQKLDQLLRCCPPCHYAGPITAGTITGYGIETFLGQEADTVTFNVLSVGDPKVVEFGQPDLARYGKFRWIENSNFFRPLEWINSNGEVKHAPSAECTGFAYVLDPGVVLSWSAVYRDGIVEHFGVK